MASESEEQEEETKQEYRMGVDDPESEGGYTNPQGEGGTRLKKDEPKSPTETLPTAGETARGGPPLPQEEAKLPPKITPESGKKSQRIDFYDKEILFS